MESGQLDQGKPVGAVLDIFGYLFFPIGLIAAAAGAYLNAEELLRELERGSVGYWPIGLAVVGFVLFLIAKLSRIRSGVLVSFGSKGMTPRQSVFYFFGFVLMAVGYGLTFSWILK